MKNLSLFIILLFLFISYSELSYSQDATSSDTTTQIVKQDVCPVSGEAIAPGDGVEYSYLGTAYKFCCKGCIKKFKAEPMDYIKGEVKCPISGESASKENFTVVDDVKYYFCCSHCKEKFEKEPQKYLNKE